MTREHISLFDTTLRDGQQTPGVDFSLDDKLVVMEMLDSLGVDYIEGGYPGANPTDTALFSEDRKTKAKFTAFGMVKRAGRSVSNDSGLQDLIRAKSSAICFVAKSWDYHVRVALGCTNEENLDSIRQSVEAATFAGKEVLVDCEHFFDGYKANPEYALACAKAAYDSGARWVVLCDTNGGTMPAEISEIVHTVTKTVPGNHLGIHAHNDTDQAVANSLAAIDAGCRHVQGTLNGIGERCGNANLVSIIATLGLKKSYRDRFAIGVDDERLQNLTHVARSFDELLNRAPNAQAPYVGKFEVIDIGLEFSEVLAQRHVQRVYRAIALARIDEGLAIDLHFHHGFGDHFLVTLFHDHAEGEDIKIVGHAAKGAPGQEFKGGIGSIIGIAYGLAFLYFTQQRIKALVILGHHHANAMQLG